MAERLSREELEARYDELEQKYNRLGWRLKSLQRENERLRNTATTPKGNH